MFAIFIFAGGTLVPVLSFAQSSSDIAERRAELERRLKALESQIETQEVFLNGKRQERVSLERDVGILEAEIEKAQLSIRARNIAIQELQSDISTKEDVIDELNGKLDREKDSLGQLIRLSHEINDYTLVEIVLGNKNFSEFFEDIESYDAIKLALKDSFDVIEETKELTSEQKSFLETKQSEEEELRQLQELEKQKIQREEAEKEEILEVTKGEEAAYQRLIATNRRSAAQIRAELFQLRDSAAIPFGEALDLANFASSKTGVRPAFILGVLQQETELGENLGTGTWRVDMHPDRDRPVFQIIADTLGFDPDLMPVSKQPSYGWGGAMGPAQFIPSTWACYGGYVNTSTGKCGRNPDRTWVGPWRYDASKDRIRKLIGKSSPSNPWDNQDAFMASATLLMDNGAVAGSPSSERLAALRYFAGWANASNPAYAFYGDGVLAHARYYQSLIDQLGGS